MATGGQVFPNFKEKIPLNLAIVGGGRACKFFLNLLRSEYFPFLEIHIAGVCDINPEAEGLVLARQMGIPITDNFKDLLHVPDLDGIIELTNNREVLLELIRQRPQGVGVVEHNIGRVLRSFFILDQKLKSAEHEAILEKMSSDFLIQQSNAAILVLNTDYTIAEANEVYLRQVGRTKNEVIGAHCYEVFHGLSAPCSSSRPDLSCPMVETLRTGKSAHVIHEMARVGQESSYDNIVTYPLKDRSGRIIRIIEIWRDITEEISRRWEKRVEQLKANLNQLVAEDRMITLGKLVASCVHEINNPIQGLLTFSSLMQEIVGKKNPDETELAEFREYLGLMTTELERCGRIVSGLLSFSRESPLEYKDIDLNDVVRAVISLTRHRMALQNIELTTDLEKSPLLVCGDANRLQQCILNLVFNAMEAMPGGGRLALSTKRKEPLKEVCLTIEDSGHGIQSEDLDHIFDPFFTTKKEGAGTGLGLSIVYGVVKNHQGKVEVTSRPGAGSRFSLSFPGAGGAL